MKTTVVTFRLDLESPAGRIYERWINEGYKPRSLMQNALMALEGYEPQALHEMSEATLTELQKVVERLENVAQSIQDSGGVITPGHQRAIDDALDPEFLNGMKAIVRPGFTRKPEEE